MSAGTPDMVFTPGSPVRTKDLFHGRVTRLRRVIDAVPAPGRHPVIYGQRGVGKTSLAGVLEAFLDEAVFVASVTCTEQDTFRTIRRRALHQVYYAYDEPSIGINPASREG